MKFIDWFAGIGGFRRGMELAGHECVGFCEFDKFATASYISMHLLTDEQRKRLDELPQKKRQKEILKDEYRNGEWYANDVIGMAGVAASLSVDNVILSSLLGVFAFSSFWTIKEVFEQEDRVKKGWFPKNPKRKYKF